MTKTYIEITTNILSSMAGDTNQTYLNILQYFSMKKHFSKIKHSSPGSIKKCVDELIC